VVVYRLQPRPARLFLLQSGCDSSEDSFSLPEKSSKKLVFRPRFFLTLVILPELRSCRKLTRWCWAGIMKFFRQNFVARCFGHAALLSFLLRRGRQTSNSALVLGLVTDPGGASFRVPAFS